MTGFFENALLYHLTVAAIIVAASWFLSRAVRSLLNLIGRRIIAKTVTDLDDKILGVVLAHVKPLMVVTGLHLAIREIRKGPLAGELTINQILDYGEAVLYIAVVLLVIKIVLGIIREIVHWYLDRVSADGTANLNKTLGPLTNKAVNLAIGLIALIVVLDHFSVNIGSLLVSLGVGSLAVALAAQDTLANMIAGIVILVDRPFRVGDRIELSTGQIGDVKEIGLRSTRMVNFDNNLIIIPNAELVKGRITNHAYPYESMRLVLRFDLAYGTDTEKVRVILLGLASEHPEVLKDPPPQVFVTAISEHAVQFMLTARATSFSTQFGAETAIREQAYRIFQREGIDVPVPRRIVQMHSS